MKRQVSIFMIVLVLSLPFVIAQEFNLNKYSGKDGANGYANIEDEVTVEVLVQIPGEDIISPEQVRFYIEDSYVFFDSCDTTGTQGYYECILFEPDFQSYEPVTFTIELRDDDKNIVGSETKTIYIDNLPPVMKEMNIDPLVSGGEVKISYLAHDYGLIFGQTSECSGIKSITIEAISEEGIVTETIATDTVAIGECTHENVIDATIQTSGAQTVCATVIDHLNKVSAPICHDINVDKAAPTIESLTILDPSQNFELTHVKPGEQRQATINAVVTDDAEIDKASVYAKFAQLNPNLPDFIPPDNIVGDVYSWERIPVSEVSSCNIKVKAKDQLGNEAENEFPCSIGADDVAPVVKELISEGERDGIPLYGYGTTLIIEFEDKDSAGGPGVGMQRGEAFVDLSALGLGSFVKADYCSKIVDAVWQCSWELFPGGQEGSYIITLEGASDDLENAIDSPVSFEIEYDNQGPIQPEIVDFKVVGGEEGFEYQGGAVKNNFVQYTVRSGSFETGFANFTDISGNEKVSFTECVDVEENIQDCTFEERVEVSGPYEANIEFTFYDDAQNSASVSTKLDVYGIDGELDSTYWTIKSADVECSPKVIDREMASILPQFVSCRVDIKTPRRDISTLAIAAPSIEDCKGDSIMLRDIYATNTAEGSRSPYLFLTLEARDFYEDQINIECPIQVLTKKQKDDGFYVSPAPQELDVNFTLSFYNNPLGDLHSNIEFQIKDAMDDSLANAEWLGKLNYMIGIGKNFCKIKMVTMNTVAALESIGLGLGILESLLRGSVVGASAAEGVRPVKTTMCTSEEALSEAYSGGILDNDYFNAFCDMVGCNSAEGKDGGFIADAGNYIGGAVPWCQDARGWLDNNLGPDLIGMGTVAYDAETPTRQATGGTSYGVRVQDSIILSAYCLCLPGVIYNLEKLRQINCFKAVCLNDYVKEQGYPTSFCNEMKDFYVCQYVMGQVFSLMPFMSFVDELIDMVVTFVTDPVALIGTYVGKYCLTECPKEGATFYLCSGLKTVSTMAEAIASWKGALENDFKPVGTEYCDRMEEIKEELG